MKILVATDGSRGGVAALNFAARLVLRDDESELIIMTVDTAEGADPASERARRDGGDTKPRRHAQRVLDGAARRMTDRKVRTRFELVSARRVDEIPDVISREADRVKADLVVIGSEGRDTLSEWVVGGVALRLIYVARRPVTVVRPPRRRKVS
jgi:nucleotide-binding universal stress UspA family protein